MEDGRCELIIPFRQPEELLLDIVRYAAEVEVVSQDLLRDAVCKRLHDALHVHQKSPWPEYS